MPDTSAFLFSAAVVARQSYMIGVTCDFLAMGILWPFADSYGVTNVRNDELERQC